jgi:NTE family protein
VNARSTVASDDPHRPRPLRDWLAEGPFTLALSSGFFGFFAHAGALAALEDEGLVPSDLRGSSAGALVSATWAAGLDARAIAKRFFELRRSEFWDPGVGFGFLRGRKFRALLTDVLPVHAFERCRAPVSISVFDVLSVQTRVLSRGDLVPAVVASCSVPGMFHPVWHEGRPLLDGGVLDRPALHGVPNERRVLLHHLPSRSRAKSRDVVPKLAKLRTVTMRGLPQVDPFRLDRGVLAFDHAYAAMREALSRPADPWIVTGAVPTGTVTKGPFPGSTAARGA